MAKKVKTNAMRILDGEGIVYSSHEYENKDGAVDGVSVAHKLGVPPETVYKTLVTCGASREYYVFVVPVAKELDLKAAAKAVGEKHVEMIRVNDINKVTGYIRGGCSPIGMKKEYTTVLDAGCESLSTMLVSAGKIGHQIEISPKDLAAIVKATFASIVHEA